MGFVGILREPLPTEPYPQVGGISFCGAAESQPRSNGTPLGFPRLPMPVAHAELGWRDVGLRMRRALALLKLKPILQFFQQRIDLLRRFLRWFFLAVTQLNLDPERQR